MALKTANNSAKAAAGNTGILRHLPHNLTEEGVSIIYAKEVVSHFTPDAIIEHLLHTAFAHF